MFCYMIGIVHDNTFGTADFPHHNLHFKIVAVTKAKSLYHPCFTTTTLKGFKPITFKTATVTTDNG